MKKTLLFIALFHLFFLSADDSVEPALMKDPFHKATHLGDPSSIVMDCVSTISGEYFFRETTMQVHGAEPIAYSHYYSSAYRDARGMDFQFMPHLTATFQKYKSPEGRGCGKDERKWKVFLKDENGAQMRFKILESHRKMLCREKHSKSPFVEFRLQEEKMQKEGMTNTAYGSISAQTNPHNYRVLYHSVDRAITVYTPNGTKRYYKVGKGRIDPPSNIKRAYLQYESFPNGHIIFYEWEKREDIPWRLKRVYSTVDGHASNFASFDIDHKHKGDKDPSFTIFSNDQKKTSYQYSQTKHVEGEKYPTLSHISGSDLSNEHFDYSENLYYKKHKFKRRGMVNKRTWSSQSIEVTYYGQGENKVIGEVIDLEKFDDPIVYRVKEILQPADPNTNKPIAVASFIYYPGIPKEKEGYTEVYDALHNKTIYRYCPSLRLQEIEKFQNENGHYISWNKEKFTWEGINLISKSLIDSSGKAVFSTTYGYDEKGNVKKKTILGNFSGKNPITHSLDADGLPISEKVDSYSTEYSFIDLEIGANKSLNQIASIQEENGLLTKFKYLKGTNLIAAKFLCYDGKIQKRHFFFYDELYLLNKEIIDDGESESASINKGVTQRFVKKYHLNKVPGSQYYGMPLQVEEFYEDFREKTLSS